MTSPIANARMYSVNARVKQAWRHLLEHVLERARLDWPVVDYDAPAPLDALWARDDLGLALMCGLPFARRRTRPTLVAAVIPSPARYHGRPVYFTDIVVRADSPNRTLQDTFGGRVGYTLADSMSGGVAFQQHLAGHRASKAGEDDRLYRQAVGGLIHARGVIDALVEGRIDVGPLDSYYHDLLRHHEPAFAARVRTIETTVARPIPPLVATAPLVANQLQVLQQALVELHDTSIGRELAEELLIERFMIPDAADYAVLKAVGARPAPAFEAL